MERKKTKLAWIPKKANRRKTFRGRRESLFKQVRELSTLCNVKACAIVYDPDDAGKPETWPPDQEEAKEILSSFRSTPEVEQTKRMVEREEYLRRRKEKLEKLEKRIVCKNVETLVTIFLHKCMVGERSVDDLTTVEEAECLMGVIELKMKEVEVIMREMEKGEMVLVDHLQAEDGRERGSDMKGPCNSGLNAPMIDGDDYGKVSEAADDWFWGCSDNYSDHGGLWDVSDQQPRFSADQRSPWMEMVMTCGDDRDVVNETGDDDGFITDCRSNYGYGYGGLEEMFRGHAL